MLRRYDELKSAADNLAVLLKEDDPLLEFDGPATRESVRQRYFTRWTHLVQTMASQVLQDGRRDAYDAFVALLQRYDEPDEAELEDAQDAYVRVCQWYKRTRETRPKTIYY